MLKEILVILFHLSVLALPLQGFFFLRRFDLKDNYMQLVKSGLRFKIFKPA